MFKKFMFVILTTLALSSCSNLGTGISGFGTNGEIGVSTGIGFNF